MVVARLQLASLSRASIHRIGSQKEIHLQIRNSTQATVDKVVDALIDFSSAAKAHQVYVADAVPPNAHTMIPGFRCSQLYILVNPLYWVRFVELHLLTRVQLIPVADISNWNELDSYSNRILLEAPWH